MDEVNRAEAVATSLVLGASTGIDLTEDIALTPGVYHQISMDDSVNNENETWAALSMTYKF